VTADPAGIGAKTDERDPNHAGNHITENPAKIRTGLSGSFLNQE